MCPLRVILIFLSAAIAGFFVLRSLKNQPELDDDYDYYYQEELEKKQQQQQLPLSTKVGSAISKGFWTCVDMASGRYLWRVMMDPSSAAAAAAGGEKSKKC